MEPPGKVELNVSSIISTGGSIIRFRILAVISGTLLDAPGHEYFLSGCPVSKIDKLYDNR